MPPGSPGPARDDRSSPPKVIIVVRERGSHLRSPDPDTGEMLDYDRVRLLWPDHLGLARGKYLPREHAAKGTAHCLTLFTLGFDRDMTPHDGALFWQGLPDCDAVFDPENVYPGWEKSTGVVVPDIKRLGQPVPLSPRNVLVDVVERWK